MAGWVLLMGAVSVAGADNWPQFRGASARGVADGSTPPAKWDTGSGENIKWKTPIPGLGHSSPVIWGDRVFVTTSISGKDKPTLKVGLYGDITPLADDTKHSWRVYCLDRDTGKILWERVAHEGVPKIKRHPKSTHANCTPATDGKRVVAFFGSEGLYCYDLDGKLLWEKDLGVLDAGFWRVPGAQWGFGSSPVLHDGKVYVQCDVQKDPFLAAFDADTGEELWRTPRNDVCTWSTPTVFKVDGRVEVIANGYHNIAGYDAATGERRWWMDGGSDIPVPTPIVAHDLIFITSSHGQPRPVYAIRTGAHGDIGLKDGEKSNKFIAWSRTGRGAYMQTPIVYRDYLYTCLDNGILTCYEAKTGEQAYRVRMGGGKSGFTASPVAADGKLYFASEDGEVYVIKAGPSYEIIAVNSMGEYCMATPAITGDDLFIRTQQHLFCIGN